MIHGLLWTFLMGRLSLIVVVFWCVTVSVVFGSDLLKCDESTVYRVRKSGKASCKKCPTCTSAGYGLNTTVKRLENEHGFLSCYPCVKCPDKTFREFDSKEPECRPCTLDCSRLNRYESVLCGHANPGHCGECRHGFNTESKESNSMCYKTNKVTDKPTNIKHGLYTQTKVTVYPQEGTKTSEVKKNNGFLDKIPLTIQCLLVVLTVLVPGIAAGCYRLRKRSNLRNKKNRKTDNLEREVASTKKLIVSKDSELGEDNLETDGDGQVRGERPTVLSINELEGIGNATNSTKYKPETTQRTAVVLEYNERILDKDDTTLTVVADSISGEARHELFQSYLKIEKSKTEPEEEKWLNHKISFPDYILNVLKLWLQREDRNATLKALCNALVMANFDVVVKKVLDLPENKNVSLNVENDEIKEKIEIML